MPAETSVEIRPEVAEKDEDSRAERPAIKPPTSSFGIFAVFEACIPGQVSLKNGKSGPSQSGAGR